MGHTPNGLSSHSEHFPFHFDISILPVVPLAITAWSPRCAPGLPVPFVVQAAVFVRGGRFRRSISTSF